MIVTFATLSDKSRTSIEGWFSTLRKDTELGSVFSDLKTEGVWFEKWYPGLEVPHMSIEGGDDDIDTFIEHLIGLLADNTLSICTREHGWAVFATVFVEGEKIGKVWGEDELYERTKSIVIADKGEDYESFDDEVSERMPDLRDDLQESHFSETLSKFGRNVPPEYFSYWATPEGEAELDD
jgi:hypothetical protein